MGRVRNVVTNGQVPEVEPLLLLWLEPRDVVVGGHLHPRPVRIFALSRFMTLMFRSIDDLTTAAVIATGKQDVAGTALIVVGHLNSFDVVNEGLQFAVLLGH